MKTYMNMMTDAPERKQVYKSVSYACFGLVILPWFLTFCNFGFSLRPEENIWVDMTFHIINFAAALVIFFGYLRESFWNVRCGFRKIMKQVAIGAGAMVVVGVSLLLNGLRSGNILLTAGVLPLAEMEMLNISGILVLVRPAMGALCMVLLAPVTISCLFYATAFAPICSYRPWLAYGMTALMLAIPKLIQSLTFWSWSEELVLYLIQLPIHLIACRLYQKTDTVWAPIFALMIANLVGCGLLLLIGT